MSVPQPESEPPAAGQPQVSVSLSGHAVVAGFGVPGRTVAEALTARHIPCCVIELNPRIVERVSAVQPITPGKAASPGVSSYDGVTMLAGDVSDEQTLRRAGIERAALFAITVPSDPAALEAVRTARRLNPKLHIIVRCRYVSTAMEATRRGADEVVSEEQVVAQAFTRLIESSPLPTVPRAET